MPCPSSSRVSSGFAFAPAPLLGISTQSTTIEPTRESSFSCAEGDRRPKRRAGEERATTDAGLDDARGCDALDQIDRRASGAPSVAVVDGKIWTQSECIPHARRARRSDFNRTAPLSRLAAIPRSAKRSLVRSASPQRRDSDHAEPNERDDVGVGARDVRVFGPALVPHPRSSAWLCLRDCTGAPTPVALRLPEVARTGAALAACVPPSLRVTASELALPMRVRRRGEDRRVSTLPAPVSAEPKLFGLSCDVIAEIADMHDRHPRSTLLAVIPSCPSAVPSPI